MKIDGSFVIFVVSLNKLWNKLSSFQYFDTAWRPCVVIEIALSKLDIDLNVKQVKE